MNRKAKNEFSYMIMWLFLAALVSFLYYTHAINKDFYIYLPITLLVPAFIKLVKGLKQISKDKE